MGLPLYRRDLRLKGDLTHHVCREGSVGLVSSHFLFEAACFRPASVATMGSAILGGVFLKLRVALLNYELPTSFIAGGLMLALVATLVMMSTVDFKIFVAFSSISHMTLIFTGFYTNIYTGVLIYLVVHTLLSAAMFWLYSKEYGAVRTRLFSTFGSYSSSWLMFLWLGLPFFPVFITELFVMAMFSYVTTVGFFLLFSVLFLFCVVLLSFINRRVVAST